MLDLLQTIIDTRISPGSLVRDTLQAWRQGLRCIPRCPRLTFYQYLEVEEVL